MQNLKKIDDHDKLPTALLNHPFTELVAKMAAVAELMLTFYICIWWQFITHHIILHNITSITTFAFSFLLIYFSRVMPVRIFDNC